MNKPVGFVYSANVRDAVQILLPQNRGAVDDLKTGRSITRRLAPIAHQRLRMEHLRAYDHPEAFAALKASDQLRVLRRGVAETAIALSRLERTGKAALAPDGFYPMMQRGVEALRAFNQRGPSSEKTKVAPSV